MPDEGRVQKAAELLADLIKSGRGLEEAAQYLMTQRLSWDVPFGGVYTADEINEAIPIATQILATEGMSIRGEPIEPVPSMGREAKQRKEQLGAQLSQAGSPEELANVIWGLVDAGEIDEGQGAAFYDQYYDQAFSNYTKGLGLSEEAVNNLRQYTSPQDLIGQLSKLGVDEETTATLYRGIRPDMTAAEERNLGANIRAYGQQIQVDKQVRSIYLNEQVNEALSNPLLTEQERAKIQTMKTQLGESFIAGQSDDILKILDTTAKQAAERSVGEGQRAEALLAGIMKPKEAQAGVRELPPIPEALPIAKSFLEKTGFGEGTKMRSFIESQIPEVYQETQAARLAWWKKMNPKEKKEARSFGGDTTRLQRELINGLG